MSRFEAKFQRGYNWPWARRWIVITFLVTTIAGLLTRPCKSQIHYACPTRNDHGFRCTCSEKPRGLDITCERLRLETINSSLQHLKKWNQAIFYLKLRNSNVPTLPDYFFQNLTVKHLIVIYTNLSSVGEKAFYGLDNHLESLDLSQNRLTKIPHPALKSLRSLLQLKVSHNNITFIHGGALDGLDNLLGLNLYGNGITGLDESALSGASKTLTRLNLGSNRFKSFPIDAFKKLNNLEALEMQENYIDDISKEDFFGLRQLDSINLAFNRIKELKRETFHHLPVLNSLDLGNNAIEEIDKDTFLGVGGFVSWIASTRN